MIATFSSYDDAAAAAGDGEVVSATFTGRVIDGAPQTKPGSDLIYFLVPAETDDDAMRELAFEAKHGKPLDSYQRWVLEKAKANA